MHAAKTSKINMNTVEDNVRKIIYQRADPFDEMIAYVEKLVGRRYSTSEMNRIEANVREIIYQRSDPFDEMMAYMRKLLNEQ